jgi:hypothetical protein
MKKKPQIVTFLKKLNLKKYKKNNNKIIKNIKIWFIVKKYKISPKNTNTLVNVNITIVNYFNHIKFEMIKLLDTDFLDEINNSSKGK